VTLDEAAKVFVVVIPIMSMLLGTAFAWISGKPFRERVGSTNKILADAMDEMRKELDRAKDERDSQRTEYKEILGAQAIQIVHLRDGIAALEKENKRLSDLVEKQGRENAALSAIYQQVFVAQQGFEAANQEQKARLENAEAFLRELGLKDDQVQAILEGGLRVPQVQERIINKIRYVRGDTQPLRNEVKP
jgi:predicted RNase H-like nuclease (RuvC/YqgF family)